MTRSRVIAEVIDLRDHLYVSPDKYIAKWSSEPCSDYQIPLIRLLSLLSDGQGELVMRPSPEGNAVLDIVRHSSLNEVLEADGHSLIIRFRASISHDLRCAIAGYLASRAAVIID